MDKFQKWVGITGIFSVFIATISLVVTLIGIRNDVNKIQINEWQEVAVYSIISDARGNPVSFDEILKKYVNLALDLPNELPRTEIQTLALKRVLLSLLSKNAISARSNGNYAIGNIMDLIMENSFRMETMGREASSLVGASPGDYTIPMLKRGLKNKFQAQDSELRELMFTMLASGMILQDSKGKLSDGQPIPPQEFFGREPSLNRNK